ncbi:hydroxymethylglutaryl-CoA reductase, degradative [Batrachochytrium salamandrivorans]|nr:hydroxymethylglutaryl-CoA reductase, degradative [Batrachochytrium salamandrivorans]
MSSLSSPSPWSGFYRKAIRERQTQLCLAFPSLFGSTDCSSHEASNDTTPGSVLSSDETATSDENRAEFNTTAPGLDPFPLCPISDEVADNMIENCVGTIGLPIGLALNFVVNGEPLIVPMVIEEPSVVAAVSGAAKTICHSDMHGGFQATASDRNVIFAQIQLLDVYDVDIDRIISQIQSEKRSILEIANEYCASMLKRGGGAVDLKIRKITRSKPKGSDDKSMGFWLVVHIYIDVCDAMGANCASTVAEGVAPFLSRLSGARIGLRIVSNLSSERYATSGFKIPISKLAYKGVSGEDVSKHIVESFEWACDDHYRAITHNKGIMNGIDAVAVATGQDWRAIEAASHISANMLAHSGGSPCIPDHSNDLRSYGPLSRYWIEDGDHGEQLLCAEMRLPICVGAAGGALSTNPVYRYHLGLMGNPDSKKLAMIMVSVGLAQNFAALRALCTEGIQRGHMSLHARNISIAVGAPPHAIQECASFMVKCGRITSLTAKEYLAAHHLQNQIERINKSSRAMVSEEDPNGTLGSSPHSLSMFCFEEAHSNRLNNKLDLGALEVEDRLSLNIAFASYSEIPVNIDMTSINFSTSDPLVAALFGSKTFEWINSVPGLLGKIKLDSVDGSIRRSNMMLSKKLKLISVFLNILTRRLLALDPKTMTEFLAETSKLAKNSQTEKAPEHFMQSTDDTCRHHAVDGVFKHSANVVDGSALHSADTSGQQHYPNFGIFQRDAYHAVDFVRHRSNVKTLLVGVPLFVALWQVFNYRVAQWVGDVSLATSLVDHQQRIIDSLASTLPDNVAGDRHFTANPIDLTNSMTIMERKEHISKLLNLHAERFQATLILLCDSISLDIPLSTQPQRHALASLGRRLEREQAIAHDLSPERIIRDLSIVRVQGLSYFGDLRNGLVNVFLIWLQIVREWSLDRILSIGRPQPHVSSDCTSGKMPLFLGLELEMRDFIREMALFETESLALSDSMGTVDTALLDLNRVLNQYREYYGVLDLYKSNNTQ